MKLHKNIVDAVQLPHLKFLSYTHVFTRQLNILKFSLLIHM